MRLSRYTIVLLGVLLVLTLSGGFADRQAEVAAGGPGQGPGYISISPAAFQPSDASLSYQIQERDALALVNTAAGEGRFHAPLSLPNGATLTWMRVFFDDQNLNDGEDGRISLISWAPLPPRSGRGRGQVTTVNGDAVQSVELDHQVNNGLYNYAITLDLYPAIYLYGVLIEYRYEASLPVVAR